MCMYGDNNNRTPAVNTYIYTYLVGPRPLPDGTLIEQYKRVYLYI